MLHPHTELRFIDDTVGKGVFATHAIPRGTVLWVQCALDQRLTAAEVAALDAPFREIIDHFAFIAPDGHHVLCWDLAKWVNHSCDPTTLALGPFGDIAVRDIAAGEELTVDYGTLNLKSPLTCRCGRPTCRGTVSHADALILGERADSAAREAVIRIPEVPQPVLTYATAAQRAAIVGWASDPSSLPSQSANLYVGALR